MAIQNASTTHSKSNQQVLNGVYILVDFSILYFNYLVSVTAGGPVSPRGHM